MSNNAISNQKNQRFSKVQEELKRLLSIIMYSVEEQVDSFDTIMSNSNNPEDIKIAEELDKSSKKLDKSAQEYVQSIGIPSKPHISSKKKEDVINISTTKVTTINPIINNVKSKDSNITISKSRDDFDIEH